MVFSFILRDVNLLGIDSAMCLKALREKAWQRLATDLDFEKSQNSQKIISSDKILSVSEEMS